MPEQAAEGPGRECAFPSTMTNMVFALYGIQTDDEERTKHWLYGLRGLFDDPNGPGRVERSHGLHPLTGHNTILMAYWTDMGAARAWHDRPEVRQWWAGLPDDEQGVGYWRELLAPAVGRFHFFGVGPHKVASHALLEAKGSDNFGYWGGYRDRMAQHDTDTFTSDLDELPPSLAHPSYGRRLSVSVPNNLCFVREGADPSHITMAKERDLWERQLKPASQKWVQYLAENSKTSGCVAIIDTVEQDLDTGEDLDKNSQFAYFLSLRHLERAARTQPSHLALYNTFMGTFMELVAEGIDMGLFIWAEAHILQNGELNAEYVNCHPSTGLLPHFATVEAAVPAPV